MDDRYDPNLLLGYVEDELIAADRARVEAILAEDPALASLVADMRKNRELLRDASSADPPRDLAEGAMAALERQLLFDDASPSPAPPTTPTHRFRIVPLLTYGGIAAVLALTATVVFQSLQSDQADAPVLAMEAAPPPSMSLAEATLEAQRKAGQSPMADAAETTSSADTIDPLVSPRAPQDFAFGDAESAPGEPIGGLETSLRERLARLDENPEARSVFTPEAASTPMAGEDLASSITPSSPAQVAPATPVLETESNRDEGQAEPFADAFGGGFAAAGQTSPKSRMQSGADESHAETQLAASSELTPFNTGNHIQLSRPTSQLTESTNAQQYTLNVVTAAPDRSLQRLNVWAISNNIEVVPASHDTFALHGVADRGYTNEEELGVGRNLTASQAQDRSSLSSSSVRASRREATRLDQDNVLAAAGPPQRVQLRVSPQQVPELVGVLSSWDTSLPPAALPQRPWMNWQAPLQPAEVEVIIEPLPASGASSIFHRTGE